MARSFSVQHGIGTGGIVTPTLTGTCAYLSVPVRAELQRTGQLHLHAEGDVDLRSTLEQPESGVGSGDGRLSRSRPVNDKPSFTQAAESDRDATGRDADGRRMGGRLRRRTATVLGSCVMKTAQSAPGVHRVEQQHRAVRRRAWTAGDRAERHAHVHTRRPERRDPRRLRCGCRTTAGLDEFHGGLDTSDPRDVSRSPSFPLPGTPISFQRVDAWMTTSTSNRKFDLKAQVLRNGVVVAQKEITNLVVGLGSSFTKAVYTQIQPLIPATSFAFTTTDTLSVKLWVKLASSSGGGNSASAEVRFWYNTPGNNSHLHATRAGTTVKYYIVKPFKLQTNPAQAPGGTQYISAEREAGRGLQRVWNVEHHRAVRLSSSGGHGHVTSVAVRR